MAHGKRDFDRLIQETKRNPALSGRQRQSQMQQLLSAKRLSDQRHKAEATADAPAPRTQMDRALDNTRESVKPKKKKTPKKTSMPGIDAKMKALGIY